MSLEKFLTQVNLARYHGQLEGFYESFFQRANHPTRPLAFWIRYTLFSPKGHPEKALGELWAVFFNGETNRHIAVKQEFPFNEAVFSTTGFEVQIGQAKLGPGTMQGGVQSGEHRFSWDLLFAGQSEPLLLLPLEMYRTKLPAAKSLVGLPGADYQGQILIDGEAISISHWIGSQNHNWGIRHTDQYAWGQVAGFDEQGGFLEAATARIKLGPIWSPPLTLLVLRHNGQEYALNGLFQSIRAQGTFDYFTWHFKSATPEVEIEGTLSAPRTAFVGLNYYNPSGGTKHCLNTKIAACTVRLKDKVRGLEEVLETRNRAAFEILTDDRAHGIPISA